ncbi:hypothetical protein OG229_33775 [Streptomyces platensis]|uniref:hypothetical protein n=1 Tax=Streptomyces platensis TaxID=58346 RepID=UPI002E1555F6|nr:hypothetical protein OG229_33775 [Streptomyces platensis]
MDGLVVGPLHADLDVDSGPDERDTALVRRGASPTLCAYAPDLDRLDRTRRDLQPIDIRSR